MEPSRDDFIIAIRSAFLKKGTKQRFSLLGLLFFSILLIVLGKFNFTAINYLKITINEVVYRISFVASLPEKYIGYSYRAVEEHIRFYNDYNLKKEELEKLKSKKYETIFLEAENKRLKKVLNDINYSSELVIAKVLIDKQSPFLRSIIINKGSKNNINKGMAVLSDSYLIGKVVEVNYTTSRVLLLSDLNSKIPVTIEPGSIQSILSGDGENSGVLQYIKDNFPIADESIVYTSGTGGLLKSGIPIGKIKQNENQNNVNFFVDFSQLRYVKVSFYTEEKN
jgi:rod shape-determining protein MreC